MKWGKDSPEWQRGDTAQRRWADVLSSTGRCALPTYAFEDVTPETKAPVMLVPDGLLITPDVLSFAPGRPPAWHEVKSKSVPSFFFNKRRWEHGFDFSLVEEYRKVEKLSGTKVTIVVCEIASPGRHEVCGSIVEERKGGHSYCRRCDVELLVKPLTPASSGGQFLWIRLEDAHRIGDHRPDWPGGKSDPRRRGRQGRGGLLFPRSAMQPFVARMEAR